MTAALPHRPAAGLADRIDAIDATMIIDSPTRGPTLMRVEFPWTGKASNR